MRSFGLRWADRLGDGARSRRRQTAHPRRAINFQDVAERLGP